MIKKFAVGAIAAATTAAATVTMATATAQAAPVAALGGGSGIVVGGDSACTLTTIGEDDQNRLVGITAGHCGPEGASVAAEYLGGADQVGTVAYVDPDLDIAVIEFDRDKVHPLKRVGNVTVNDLGTEPAPLSIVCKEGRTTANTCGISWITDPVYQESWNSLCIAGGDSGAPVVVNQTLVGMVNGYLEFACVGPMVGTTMEATLNSIDQHSPVGKGFRPTA